jgi:hypothetical protein
VILHLIFFYAASSFQYPYVAHILLSNTLLKITNQTFLEAQYRIFCVGFFRYTYAPPGYSVLTVPLDVQVGEKSQIGVYVDPLLFENLTATCL